jgi:hypothetical protein
MEKQCTFKLVPNYFALTLKMSIMLCKITPIIRSLVLSTTVLSLPRIQASTSKASMSKNPKNLHQHPE